MTGHELLRAVREHVRTRRMPFRVESCRGKGSHQMIFVGDRRTTIPDLRKELRAGTLAQILKNLGLRRADLQEL